jgi:hypothetical protein
MASYGHQELLDAVRYLEYSRLFRQKVQDTGEVAIRRGGLVFKSILVILIGIVVLVLGFLFAIYFLSEVIDIDMLSVAGRVVITAWGLLLVVIFIRIVTRVASRLRRSRSLGNAIRKPPDPVLEYLKQIIAEIAGDSIESNQRLIEFESVKAQGSMYERRERWRGMLLEEDCLLYQPRTKEIRLVEKSHLDLEVKSKRSEVNRYLIFSDREIKGLNILPEIAYKRLSAFLSTDFQSSIS